MIAFTTPRPRFRVGQIVRHRRYGYRGIVVAVDRTCRAPDSWYQSNRTQPDRNQPWYHVLVDGSANVTYAAQASLEADPDPDPVEHPLVEQFFDITAEGQYQRNDRVWPGW